MTISGTVARFLVEEHKFKPMPKEVHLLGKQTIQVSLDEINRIFSAVGVEPQKVEAEFETLTRQAKSDSMSDNTFFKIFGVESVRAIDHSDFEGADIVFDLTKKIPEKYESCADLIFDGSVMDNIFDPASAMQNVIRLLRPGGRYIGVNAATTRWLPSYVAFNPYWFFDFFVVNGFRDVKIYVVDFGDNYNRGATWAESAIYLLDPNANHRDVHNYPVSTGPVALLILAEKDTDSTCDERTSQGVYRLEEEWKVFDEKLERVKKSPRPPVSFIKQAATSGGEHGFLYCGSINHAGLEDRDPNEKIPVIESGEIDFGKPFPGYNWGTLESHGGLSWRWIDDTRKESVVVVNLASDKAYKVEAKLHTAKDMPSIKALRAFCDGVLLDQQTVQSRGNEHKLVFTIPTSVTKNRKHPIHLGFSAKGSTSGADGRNVALSGISFSPK